jgi:DNA-binding transcriptional regulator YhcF (GntR family)
MDNKNVQHIQVPRNLGSTKEIKMSPTDYLIYGYMRKYMDKNTFQTFVSFRFLADLARVSVNTVQSSIKKLQDAGEIKLLDKKRGRSNIYEIQKTGKYFERFTYEFLEADNTTPEEKGVLLAMQQYTNKSDGKYAVTLASNRELADKMDMSVKVLSRIFRQLEDKGILITNRTSAFDKITGLRKTAKLVDLALVCQAVLFINKKVDEHTEQLERHTEDIKMLKKEILALKRENEKLLRQNQDLHKFNF